MFLKAGSEATSLPVGSLLFGVPLPALLCSAVLQKGDPVFRFRDDCLRTVTNGDLWMGIFPQAFSEEPSS